jgi:hypothetical protein
MSLNPPFDPDTNITRDLRKTTLSHRISVHGCDKYLNKTVPVEFRVIRAFTLKVLYRFYECENLLENILQKHMVSKYEDREGGGSVGLGTILSERPPNQICPPSPHLLVLTTRHSRELTDFQLFTVLPWNKKNACICCVNVKAYYTGNFCGYGKNTKQLKILSFSERIHITRYCMCTYVKCLGEVLLPVPSK